MKVVLKNINFLVTAYLWIHCFKIPKCLECSSFSTNMDFYLGHSLPWSAGLFRHLAAKAKNGNAFSCFLQLSSMILCCLFNNNLKERCNNETWWIPKACCDFLLETLTCLATVSSTGCPGPASLSTKELKVCWSLIPPFEKARWSFKKMILGAVCKQTLLLKARSYRNKPVLRVNLVIPSLGWLVTLIH